MKKKPITQSDDLIAQGKAFRFEDSEGHVTELTLAEINAVHEWICADDEKARR